ncbi:MAG: hypothetical protein LUH04_12280 [Clostridium sp.]|nr:hypothetical protein [Clostridium sp.]
MEYLNRVLGIHAIYKDDKITSMPNLIHARYRMQRVALDGKDVVFLYPKTELDAVSAIKKHIDRIQKAVFSYMVTFTLIWNITGKIKKKEFYDMMSEWC